MMLQFRDPSKLKTKKIVFEELYAARDSGTLEQLKELSSKRKAIEESINKSSSITEAIAREMSGGLTSHCEQEVQKLEQYLPILENLVHHVGLVSHNQRPTCWNLNLKIRWSSALTSSSFFGLKGSKFFHMNNLHCELAMTLFLFGAMLREWAYEVVSADLVQSATLLRKAAGVFHYLANDVLTHLEPAERPSEALLRIASVMSLVCLAEAQAVTVRKAEEKGNMGGLLSKLHYGVVQFLDDAAVILHSTISECKDISTRLMEFISSCKALHELRTDKYFAEGLKTEGQVGVAIGVVMQSITKVEKNIPKEKSWRLIVKQEIKNMNELLRKYQLENDFIWREKIPLQHELPSPEEEEEEKEKCEKGLMVFGGLKKIKESKGALGETPKTETSSGPLLTSDKGLIESGSSSSSSSSSSSPLNPRKRLTLSL